jgi:hypothetical protein
VARGRGIVRYVAWWMVLIGVFVGLWRLPVPPAVPLAQGTPDDLVPLLLVGLRWVALAVVAYLVVTTVLATVAEVVRSTPLRRLTDRVALPVVRRIVRAGVGASLVMGLGLGPSAAVAAPGPPGATGARATATSAADADPEPPPGPSGATGPRATVPPAADGRGARAGEADGDSRPDTADPGSEDPAAEADAADPASEDPEAEADAAYTADGHVASDEAEEHVVASGDSFWSIAAQLTHDRLGRAPSDAEVLTLWEALVDANRDRLVVADDPDLLLPGQTLRTDVTVERT